MDCQGYAASQPFNECAPMYSLNSINRASVVSTSVQLKHRNRLEKPCCTVSKGLTGVSITSLEPIRKASSTVLVHFRCYQVRKEPVLDYDTYIFIAEHS